MKWDEILLKPKVLDWENLHWIPSTFVKVMDKVFQTFIHFFSWHEQKLMKFSQHLALHLKKYLGQNLMKKYWDFIKVNWFFIKLRKFHKISWYYNHLLFHDISWYYNLLLFSFDVLCWLSLLLLVLLKVDRKILVLFSLIQNFEISDLAMAKV